MSYTWKRIINDKDAEHLLLGYLFIVSVPKYNIAI